MNRPTKISILALVLIMLGHVAAYGRGRIVSMDSPRLTVYLPSHADGSGRAVLACPGGGYHHLATEREGHDWAHFYNDLGLVYAVLEYRMPGGDRRIPLADVDAALRCMADSASAWGIRPDAIGIMGSSAGGHLACTAATNPNAGIKVKPAFQILFYPVVSLDPAITHMGSHDNFLGANPGKKLEAEWSNENFVTPTTPPAFIVLSSDDKVVNPLNSINYYAALCREGVPACLLAVPDGNHGWGYRDTFAHHNQVLSQLKSWLVKK